MKILLFGKNGQVGNALLSELANIGEVTALDRDSADYCGDLAKLDIAQTILTLNPDVIVNAAAYTAVDKAEAEQEQAKLINTDAVALLAKTAKTCDAWLVHYSTDYVFDGASPVAYREKDKTNPLNVYGLTKKAGEDAVIASGCKHLILRTSWVYGSGLNGQAKNFITTILNAAQTRDSLKIVNDQIGAPTDAMWLAQASVQTILIALNTPSVSGLYHLTNMGETSWYEVARLVLKTAQSCGMALTVSADAIAPIPTSEYKTAAVRPLNSRLDCSKAKETFGITPPEWQIGVEDFVTKLAEKKR